MSAPPLPLDRYAGTFNNPVYGQVTITPEKDQLYMIVGPNKRKVLLQPFDRDSFSFANELVWEYRFDPASNTMITTRNERPAPYTHRCFVLVRSARQFFYHARGIPSSHTFFWDVF